MSRIYFKPFTSKRYILFIFLTLSCFIFNNNAHADNGTKIVGHYYVAKDSTNMKYDDKIQWEVTSLAEWSKFMDTLQTMPKDERKDNPMSLRQREVIHFNVAYPDQKSGHDIFISEAGIQQFSRMPLDIYYDPFPAFKEFLETELSMNPGYDATNGNVDINAPGIVVIYRGSLHLKNPYWVIKPSETKGMQRYKTYINSLTPNPTIKSDSENISNSLYDNEGTFLLYLNYPDAPQQILVIGTNSTTRGTKIEQQYFYYKDELSFFSMFKKQAEDNLRATQMIEEAPEEKRRREALKGTLF
ncbi:MAG TPA: hypothetical protein DCM27_05780 [Rhodospirillaceae bacterium]|nr:hypothetical protein [Rhodospirillaceae bacterium]